MCGGWRRLFYTSSRGSKSRAVPVREMYVLHELESVGGLSVDEDVQFRVYVQRNAQ